jgi:Acetyltransferase (GNAT) domain
MRYTIERVEWKEGADEICAVLANSFPDVPTTRYAWLHERNPAGAGAVWVARDDGDRPVGTAALHARHVMVDGRRYLAGVATNFAVVPTARAFGPAVALQRAVLAACEAGEFAFVYGFPNSAAKAVFDRMGYSPGSTRRLVRVLRSGPYLEPYLERAGRAARVASRLARPLDLAMQLLAPETYHRPSRRTRFEQLDRFDRSFDEFWTRLRGRRAIVGDRDAEYMNWRYACWPTRRYHLTVLRREGDIVASVVSYVIGDVVYVSELFALDPEAFDSLLCRFLRAQRRTGARAVSIIALGDLPFADRLARYGFFQRDVDRSMVIYVPRGSPLRPLLNPVSRFTFFEGDIL